jgi:hypothetical protein
MERTHRRMQNTLRPGARAREIARHRRSVCRFSRSAARNAQRRSGGLLAFGWSLSLRVLAQAHENDPVQSQAGTGPAGFRWTAMGHDPVVQTRNSAAWAETTSGVWRLGHRQAGRTRLVCAGFTSSFQAQSSATKTKCPARPAFLPGPSSPRESQRDWAPGRPREAFRSLAVLRRCGHWPDGQSTTGEGFRERACGQICPGCERQ